MLGVGVFLVELSISFCLRSSSDIFSPFMLVRVSLLKEPLSAYSYTKLDMGNTHIKEYRKIPGATDCQITVLLHFGTYNRPLSNIIQNLLGLSDVELTNKVSEISLCIVRRCRRRGKRWSSAQH
jgi:hypothetical protein